MPNEVFKTFDNVGLQLNYTERNLHKTETPYINFHLNLSND